MFRYFILQIYNSSTIKTIKTIKNKIYFFATGNVLPFSNLEFLNSFCFQVQFPFIILAKIVDCMRWIVFFCFSIAYLFGQNYPQNYFQAPLDIPLQLSGNFGELRPNHFHAGFDFKTQQREGLNVYAAAAGYVSRIKIATNGYGKAIYISHPNGYTTVYGHLQKAVGAIEAKIQELQYAEKSFAVETYFKPGELPVAKGELIAISGNTGGSDGPHLHFEFRDSQTEKIINPLFFGLQIKDSKAPTIANLMVYPLGPNSCVNESKRPVLLGLSLQSDGTYLAQKVKATGTIGFAINAYDRDDVSFNNNGTYFTQLSHNGQAIFEVLYDQMPFDEARYVNAFIDYERYKKSHQRFQKLFYNYPYAWSNMRNVKNDGKITVVPNFLATARIEVVDFNGNKTQIDIPIEYAISVPKIADGILKTPYFIKCKTDALLEKENVSVYLPANTFYDDFYLQFEVKNDELHLHQDIVPLHIPVTITFQNDSIPVELRSKTYIATVNGSKVNYNTTKVEGATFSMRTRTLGKFKLAQDVLPPKIAWYKPPKNKDWSTLEKLNLTISDEQSGVAKVNGYINNQWVLFEYEPKLKRIFCVLEDRFLMDGTNNLKIEVIDNVGNSTIFESTFNRTKKK